MLTDSQILEQLQAFGTEQNRKIYKRHGVSDNQFGVSSANLKDLHKKVKVNHEAALKLWETGNHDARIFAMMIADPQQVDANQLEAWAQDLADYVVTDALSSFVARTMLAREKMEQWTQSEAEWIASLGWNVMSHLALGDKTLPDSYFEKYLLQIERDLHSSKNRVRHAMNNAVIAIGLRSPQLQEKAIAAAGRIGKVVVNHGETNCKTPDAIAYIHKTQARKG